MKCKWCRDGIIPADYSTMSHTCPDCKGTGVVSCPCGKRLEEEETQTIACQCNDCNSFLCTTCSADSEFCFNCQDPQESNAEFIKRRAV